LEETLGFGGILEGGCGGEEVEEEGRR